MFASSAAAFAASSSANVVSLVAFPPRAVPVSVVPKAIVAPRGFPAPSAIPACCRTDRASLVPVPLDSSP